MSVRDWYMKREENLVNQMKMQNAQPGMGYAKVNKTEFVGIEIYNFN